jgi:Skp family chaperone for outer membrane proteins
MSRLILGVLFIALFLPVLGAAQTAEKAPATPASAVIAPAKIGWMSVEQAVLTCDEGAKMIAEIRKYIDAKNAELDTLRKEAEDLHSKLSMQGAKLTDDARLDLEDKVESKDATLQRFEQDTKKDINNRQDRLTAYVSKRMGPIIEKVAKAKGLDAIQIFNASRDAWINPDLNVTEDIVKAYNQAYPVTAPKPPAAKP